MWNIAIVKGPRGMGDPHGGVGLDLYPPPATDPISHRYNY
jgi:hypothetical protein